MRGAVLFLVAACGRIGFDSSAVADAAADAPHPHPDASFTTRHWVNRNDGVPGALVSPRLTYDDARGTVLMYGGDAAVESAAMWELAASGWTSVCNPCAPGSRLGQGFAYDVVRDRIVLVSGSTNGAPNNDTWEWDGVNWAKIATSGSPGARELTQLTYDRIHQEMLLVGGSIAGTADAVIRGYDGATWTLPITTGGVGPMKLGGYGAEITIDGTGNLIALGDNADIDSSTVRDDLWSEHGVWTSICTACSGTPRNSASLIYDPALDVLWLFNGYSGAGSIAGTWQLAGSSWQMLKPEVGARDSSGVAYDRNRDVIVMYGGNGDSCAGNCAETWELVPN